MKAFEMKIIYDNGFEIRTVIAKTFKAAIEKARKADQKRFKYATAYHLIDQPIQLIK